MISLMMTFYFLLMLPPLPPPSPPPASPPSTPLLPPPLFLGASSASHCSFANYVAPGFALSHSRIVLYRYRML